MSRVTTVVMEDVHIWLEQSSRLNLASDYRDEFKVVLRPYYCSIANANDIEVNLEPSDGITKNPTSYSLAEAAYISVFSTLPGSSPRERVLSILATIGKLTGESVKFHRSYPVSI